MLHEAVAAGGEETNESVVAQDLKLLADFVADVATRFPSALGNHKSRQASLNCDPIADGFIPGKRGTMNHRGSKSRKLTMLTPHEDHCWVFAFNFYCEQGKTDEQADKLAWRDMQMEFPRLRGFDGCLPDVRGNDPNAKWSRLPVAISEI